MVTTNRECNELSRRVNQIVLAAITLRLYTVRIVQEALLNKINDVKGVFPVTSPPIRALLHSKVFSDCKNMRGD